MSPTRLQVEYQTQPLAVATRHPRFSWWRDVDQVAYELELHDASGELLGTSGRVVSDESHLVELPGVTLASDADYAWRVRLWSDAAAPGPWAEGSFGTGLFDVPAQEIGLQLLTQGVLSGLVSTICYGWAVRVLGGTQAAAYTAITPVAAALAGGWLLAEPLGSAVITAAVVTGVGVLLSTGILSRRRG